MKTSLWRSICMSCLILFFITPLSHARETDRGTVIYEQEGLLVTVYGWTKRPGRKLAEFCSGSDKSVNYRSSYNVSVTYNVPHKERTKLIAPSYEAFVKDKIYPNLFRTCGGVNITEINMSMSKIGEYTTQDWRETMTFAIADNGRTVTQTNYYPNPIAKANMSMEEIEALMPSKTGSASAHTQRSSHELFNDGKVTIYAREDLWCRPKNRSKGRPKADAGLDIIVPVSYSELKNWLRSHYGNFDYKIIKPLIDKTCLPSGSVNAKFYQDGESAHLERVIYGWEKTRVRGGFIDPFATEKFAVISRVAGQTRDARLAAIKKQKAELDVWDMPCQGKFCALPGGAYFQAIHDGDYSALKRMDGHVDIAITRWLRRTLGESVASKKQHDYSLLPVIADTYFYHYQYGFMLGCTDDLMQKTYSYRNPTFEMPDYGDFAMPDMGGEIDYATYVVPRNFLPLCDKICDAFGGKQDRLPIESLNIKPARTTLNSVYQISDKFRCDQKEIKRLESNLIRFTQDYLKRKTTWLPQS